MESLKDSLQYLSILREKAVNETIQQLFDNNDLTQQQLHYLKVIIGMKNPSVSELARELQLKKPTVTVLIDKLVSKGYIKRVKSDKDRRSMHIHAEEKGLLLNDIIGIAFERLSQEIQANLSETENAILVELVKKIVRENKLIKR